MLLLAIVISVSEINPMAQVPAIVDGRFKLFERYMGCFFHSLNLVNYISCFKVTADALIAPDRDGLCDLELVI